MKNNLFLLLKFLNRKICKWVCMAVPWVDQSTCCEHCAVEWRLCRTYMVSYKKYTILRFFWTIQSVEKYWIQELSYWRFSLISYSILIIHNILIDIYQLAALNTHFWNIIPLGGYLSSLVTCIWNKGWCSKFRILK